MSTTAITSDGHAADGRVSLKSSLSASKGEPLSWTTFYNVINGKLETTKETRCSINPATEKNNPQVPVASREDVDRAMDAAEKAFKPWAALPYDERRKAVLEFCDALETEKEPFSKLLTQEQAKPVKLYL
jgi:acyl-CoA reductase-like NAD-dependent aldehyde dehydrogenase